MENEHARQDAAVTRLNTALKRFRKAMSNGMVVMKELGSSLGEVSNAFEEIAATTTEAGEIQSFCQTYQETPSSEPARPQQYTSIEGPRQGAGGATSSAAALALIGGRFPEPGTEEERNMDQISLMDISQEFRTFVKCFSAEVTYLREGTPFMEYNEGIHGSVIAWLKIVDEELDKTGDAAKKRKKTFSAYQHRKVATEKKEAKYVKHNKPIASSKRYARQVEARNAALDAYRHEKAEFHRQFAVLMKRNAFATLRSVKKYLSLTAGYMRSVVAALERTDTDLGMTPPPEEQISSEQRFAQLNSLGGGEARLNHGQPVAPFSSPVPVPARSGNPSARPNPAQSDLVHSHPSSPAHHSSPVPNNANHAINPSSPYVYQPTGRDAPPLYRDPSAPLSTSLGSTTAALPQTHAGYAYPAASTSTLNHSYPGPPNAQFSSGYVLEQRVM